MIRNQEDQKGFTLIEVIVVVGIIAILASILVPMVLKEIEESRGTKAQADVRSIATALTVLKKDTGQWPVSANCTNSVTLITGVGTIPVPLPADWDNSASINYDSYLSKDDNGCWPATWKGPYMARVSADPWGNAYLTNAKDFLLASGPIWIISPGPNNVLDTPASSAVLFGDDIGTRLR